MEHIDLKRTLGLGSTVSIIIGYTIGIGIFVLIGPLAYKTGPAISLTFALAAIPALFMCFTSAQLGSALPVTGANYVVTSRTLGPFWGFMTAWSVIITTVIGVPLVAYGFADYLSLFVKGLHPMAVAILVTVVFGLVNILGTGIMGWVQNLMVLIFMSALLLFGIGGLFHIHPEYLRVFAPNGFHPVLLSTIPAYFSYVGFMVIVDLGEEIRNPAKNIPRSILISFVMILISYVLVSYVLTGVLPWQGLKTTRGAVAVASQKFLPGWGTVFIQFGAIFAALTTLNAILATSPREIYALARDRIFPRWLAVTAHRTKSPYMAVILVTLLSIGGVLISAGVVQYAFVTVMGVMTIHFFVALGVIRMRTKLPEHYRRSPYKLKGFWRLFWPVGAMVIAVAYVLIGFVEAPVSVGIFFGCICIGGLIYLYQRKRLAREGIDMAEMFEKEIQHALERMRNVEAAAIE